MSTSKNDIMCPSGCDGRFSLLAARVRPPDQSRIELPRPWHLAGRGRLDGGLAFVHTLTEAASRAGGPAKRLPGDRERRYAYEPLLLETFVERNRFRGTCYRAANWLHVGETQGPGKLDLSGGQTDRQHRHPLPIKHVYVYPLHQHFRQELRATPGP